ncbi:uncharacterized protein LOC122403724 [Colletes gigas]|uniref:uncharacterized protein LOC122403724 n=1 Tax=Colletes gigas TaxID=935657 RepID=UPI001C9AFD20|nr:uncharacterized protein LOC122403724 [Colletes gigas]
MDEADSPPVIEIPIVHKDAGIATSWVNSNKIGIYTCKNLHESYHGKYDSTVHILKPEVILFSPQLRKLVNESNGVFLSIQKIRSSSGDVRPELLKHSKQY